jgi:hypothetical protein
MQPARLLFAAVVRLSFAEWHLRNGEAIDAEAGAAIR